MPKKKKPRSIVLTRVDKNHPSKEIELSPEISRCIRVKSRVVDISGCHPYFLKDCQCFLERVSNQIKKNGTNNYRLTRDFFGYFIMHLGEEVLLYYNDPEYAFMDGGDFVANALRVAAINFRNPDLPHPSQPKDFILWSKTSPLSEAWARLGVGKTHWAKWEDGWLLEDPGEGKKFRPIEPGPFELPRVGLSYKFNCNAEELPRLKIEIEGAPVCALMKAMLSAESPSEQQAARMEAKRIWDSLIEVLSIRFGLREPEGRPLDVRLHGAVFMREIEGLPWLKIADKLCRKNHPHRGSEHVRHCADRFRKIVDGFWDRRQKAAKKLPPLTPPATR